MSSVTAQTTTRQQKEPQKISTMRNSRMTLSNTKGNNTNNKAYMLFKSYFPWYNHKPMKIRSSIASNGSSSSRRHRSSSSVISSWILLLLCSTMIIYLIVSCVVYYHWMERLDTEKLLQTWKNQQSKNYQIGGLRYGRGGEGRRPGGGGGQLLLEPVKLPRPNSQRVQYDKNHYDVVVNVQNDPKVMDDIMATRMNELRLPYTLTTVEDTASSSSSSNNNNKNQLLLSQNELQQCPSTPVVGYPQTWNVIDVLTHWNPDDTNIPSDRRIYQGLCYIDWNDTYQRTVIATIYRKAELPFVIRNHYEVMQASIRWSNSNYISQLLGGSGKDDETKEEVLYRNEHSMNNHFPYWKTGQERGIHPPKGWKPPTDNVQLSFDQWYEKAIELEQVHIEGHETKNLPHWYLRLNAEWQGRNDFLYDELPIFNPTTTRRKTASTTTATADKKTKDNTMDMDTDMDDFFMVDKMEQRGINCRLGMKGVIAEAHYDLSRNFILLLHGQKRYILAHPNQCQNLELYPQGHPSARHSSVNWSDPNDWIHRKYFPKLQVNEVVLQAGDILYLPTSWFHFIVSLNLNYQCNARSGTTYENKQYLTDCGF